ncbi:MAG: hypothetical protein ACLR6J_19225 [Parabacteroides merdae]
MKKTDRQAGSAVIDRCGWSVPPAAKRKTFENVIKDTSGKAATPSQSVKKFVMGFFGIRKCGG